jgi:hypothetical protein
MEGTLLIGDHVLVDKLVYAPPGALASRLLPYRDVRRGDIIVFRYPVDIKEDLREARDRNSGRSHIRLVEQAAHPQRARRQRAVRAAHFSVHRSSTATISPRAAGAGRDAAGDRYARQPRGERRAGGAARLRFRHGRQPRRFARQPLLGIRAAPEHRRDAADHLLVV